MVDIVELVRKVDSLRRLGHGVRYSVNGICDGFELKIEEKSLYCEGLDRSLLLLEKRELERMRCVLLKKYS